MVVRKLIDHHILVRRNLYELRVQRPTEVAKVGNNSILEFKVAYFLDGHVHCPGQRSMHLRGDCIDYISR